MSSNLGAVTQKLLCLILVHLSPPSLRKCRLVSKEVNSLIETFFVMSPILSDTNVTRAWSPHVQLPWIVPKSSKKLSRAEGLNKQSQNNKKLLNWRVVVRVGDLQKRIRLNPKCLPLIKEMEFLSPIPRTTIKRLVKECWACTVLRFHTSAFLASSRNYCFCTKRSKHEIQVDANQLRKLFIVFDKATMTSKLKCTVPYLLTVNLLPAPPLFLSSSNKSSSSSSSDFCEIYFIPEGMDDAKEPLEIFKTWLINDRIIDLFSRPDCLRKLTYFARVTHSELRSIRVKLVSDLLLPGTVSCSKVLTQPIFYPQMKRYPTGPFNGAVLTYWSTKRRSISTYRPVHISSDALFMVFPQAAALLISETPIANSSSSTTHNINNPSSSHSATRPQPKPPTL